MIRIQITKSGLATVGKTGFRNAGREAIRVPAEHWWKVYLPLHFKTIAYTRYKFAARDKRTNIYKRNRQPWPFGENNGPAIGEVAPLVFTGRTRERLLSSKNVKAKATTYESYRADVILDAPVLNFSTGKRIDLRDEITRDNAQEQNTMGTMFDREWNKQLKAQGLKAPRRRRRTAA